MYLEARTDQPKAPKMPILTILQNAPQIAFAIQSALRALGVTA